MKFLCVCQWGHSRSVALCRVLHHHGHVAIAVGIQRSGDGLTVLSDWADHILTLETGFAEFIPPQYRHKVIDFHVGPDRWSNPYNQELLKLLEGMARERLPMVQW
jgi:hypothetical protein